MEAVAILPQTFQIHSQALVLSLSSAFAKMKAGTAHGQSFSQGL